MVFQALVTKMSSCVVLLLLFINLSHAFSLQRSSLLKISTVLYSGDAAEKMHLQPISQISGEVGSVVG